MRIVVDLQAAQAENRYRGIGRLALSLTQAMARQRGDHEMIIALNSAFPESIGPIRRAFRGLLPVEAIKVWSGLDETSALDPANSDRREATALIREAFLARLEPSILLITSLFEGFVDGAVTTLDRLPANFPKAIILYDLIPLLYQDHYLQNPLYADWYLKQLAELRKADLLLSISESSRQEAIEHAGFSGECIKTIHAGKDDHFFPKILDQRRIEDLRARFGLDLPYVLYGGGIDFRKNIEGLIRAFSRLSPKIRDQFQLAIVCSVPETERARLEAVSRQEGLATGQFVMTGFVQEEDLIDLYRLSEVFVFPSLHEGFGLPALEAMACGVAVIGSNNSSLPEVIGNPEALFDAKDEAAISQKIEKVLTQRAFRKALVDHGLSQACKFSWENSARLTLLALEEKVGEWQKKSTQPIGRIRHRKPRLAYLSPLQPQKSGIADYSSELLEHLASHYEIDVISDQPEIEDPWVLSQGEKQSICWFKAHFQTYDRVLYHFGNSAFHSHMFDLLPDFPGVVVLHDFYLSGIIAHRDLHEGARGSWPKALYASHGYPSLRAWEKTEMAELVWHYPASLDVIQNALGVIVHAANSRHLAEKWYGSCDAAAFTLIPHLRVPAATNPSEKSLARGRLGIGSADTLICAFGLIGPSKLNHRLLEAFSHSSLATRTDCHLVFVGQNQEGAYGEALLSQINALPRKGSAKITGWASSSLYRDYLAAADIGVQLRTLSRGETSGTVLDCMNHGLALIVNANGSMADINDTGVVKLEDDFTDDALIKALEQLVDNPQLRKRLGSAARKIIISDHDPKDCAMQYHQAIEAAYLESRNRYTWIPDLLVEKGHSPRSSGEQIEWARALSASFPPKARTRQLLVDISELVQRDARTGIQRVVRSILKEWLSRPSESLRVEPVYATEDQGYRYARNFTLDFIEGPRTGFLDESVDYFPGDLFLGLDLQPTIVKAQRSFYQDLRNAGVHTIFVLYDLLCVRLPETFPEGASSYFRGWLEVIAEADQTICISKATADDFKVWLQENDFQSERIPRIDWFPLGCDIENSSPSLGMPENARGIITRIKKSPSFLMVGTLEPRKAHTQALDAFEILWAEGSDATLVIVGKEGWMVESLVERLQNHVEMGRRLFWLEGISDEYLKAVMDSVNCLLAPSLGEGFGLPIVEAISVGLPVLARDIAVFREVGQNYPTYFEGVSAKALASAISTWLSAHHRGKKAVCSPLADIPGQRVITWADSASALLSLLN